MKRGLILLSSLVLISATTLEGAPSQRASALASVASTQTFVGGGTGTTDVAARFQYWAANYTSTGQLGNGHYELTSAGSSAEFWRSDGLHLTGAIVGYSGGDCGPVDPDVQCFRVNLAGSGDIANAHLVIWTVAKPGGFPARIDFLMRGTLTLRRRVGYVMVDRNGKTYAFGGIDHLGDAPASPFAADVTLTPSGRGYWIADGDGQVYAFGDTRYLGGTKAVSDRYGNSVTTMSATPTGKGYWLFLADGHVAPFGDAKYFGDLSSTMLNRPIIGSVATPTGKGYYMIASDGGVFAFGDAKFRGSMGGKRLNQPVVGIVPTDDNAGYWLVAADGGVFSFNAPFHGSMGAVKLNRPIVTMVPYAGSYLMVAADGGIFNFSNGPFFGSEGGAHVPVPIASGAATD